MKDEKILHNTLEEYGYDLKKLIFPAEGLINAICEAMERSRRDHAENVIKNIKKLNTATWADSEKVEKIIRKI